MELLESRERFSVRRTYRFLVGNGVKALMGELSASNSAGKDYRERERGVRNCWLEREAIAESCCCGNTLNRFAFSLF